jgi:hypothetical protein
MPAGSANDGRTDLKIDIERALWAIGLLLVILSGATGYLTWQVGPLRARVAALEIARVADRDELLARVETLGRDVTSVRRSLIRRPLLEQRKPVADRAATVSSQPVVAVAPAPTAPPQHGKDEILYLRRRLVPSDAAVAELLYRGMDPEEIAQRLDYSVPFVLAKTRKIEEMLRSAPDAPKGVLEMIQRGLKE